MEYSALATAMEISTEQQSLPDDNEEVLFRLIQELKSVALALKEAQKNLRRDWETLAPRERSAQSRVVKDLEQRKKLLEEEIEMNSKP
jgi:hypothetical protein